MTRGGSDAVTIKLTYIRCPSGWQALRRQMGIFDLVERNGQALCKPGKRRRRPARPTVAYARTPEGRGIDPNITREQATCAKGHVGSFKGVACIVVAALTAHGAHWWMGLSTNGRGSTV